ALLQPGSGSCRAWQMRKQARVCRSCSSLSPAPGLLQWLLLRGSGIHGSQSKSAFIMLSSSTILALARQIKWTAHFAVPLSIVVSWRLCAVPRPSYGWMELVAAFQALVPAAFQAFSLLGHQHNGGYL